jgi:hypothetical protein
MELQNVHLFLNLTWLRTVSELNMLSNLLLVILLLASHQFLSA